VPIWADIERIVPSPLDEAHAAFVYSGSLGRKQGLTQIVKFADEMKRRRPDAAILLRGAGNQQAPLDHALAEGVLDNVRREETVPPDRLSEGLAAGRIHLVLQDPAGSSFAMPSKVVAVMSAGRPILATAQKQSPLWRLGQASRAVVCVPPNDPGRLAATALRLLDRPSMCAALGRRARRYVEQHYSKETLLTRFGELLRVTERTAREPGVLIMEPRAEGHQREWLLHIAGHSAANDGPVLWLLVARELVPIVSSHIADAPGDRVRVLPIGALATRLCRHRSPVVSGLGRWWVLRRAMRRTGAVAAHALFLDHLSLPLALGFGIGRGRLSGILLRPSVHYGLLGPYQPTWRERLRDWRKAVLYRLMLRNGSLGTVLSLDPYFPRHAQRAYRGGEKVRAVPDPAHPVVTITPGDLALARTMPSDRIRFVLFGYLSERKGTLVILDALARLSRSAAARAAVMLAGQVEPAIRDAVERKCGALAAKRPELWLHVEDRHLAAAEIEALLCRADIVLAPYQRFVGSSGVLLWAARAGKPVLTQDFGLIGALVRDYRLGLAVATERDEVLSGAMTRMIEEGSERFFDRGSAHRFIADHHPRQFAQSVLASLAAA
jgi:glycosyltransferase involved in cell wall biosynthesis